jgi:hypothetical protein
MKAFGLQRFIRALLMAQKQTIGTPLLRQLVRTRKAGQLVARGVPGGYMLVMREAEDEQVLEAQRGHARCFRRLDAVVSYLQDLGAGGFTVEVPQWPAGASVARPARKLRKGKGQ